MDSDASPAPRFYVLEAGATGSKYDADAFKVDLFNRGPPATCSACGEPIGMLTWLPPYRVDLELHGESLGDLVKATGYDLLVSERFAQAFREEGLKGLEGFHPVQITKVRQMRRKTKPSEAPRYLAVTACYGRAALDLARSHIHYVEFPTCAECRYGSMDAVHELVLEAGTWKGEDIFRPRGLQGTLVVSERFERFLAKHGFTNMRLTPTEEYLWNPLARDPALATQGAKTGKDSCSR